MGQLKIVILRQIYITAILSIDQLIQEVNVIEKKYIQTWLCTQLNNMQLFSVDQQRSQALEAHAASFAQFKVRFFMILGLLSLVN